MNAFVLLPNYTKHTNTLSQLGEKWLRKRCASATKAFARKLKLSSLAQSIDLLEHPLVEEACGEQIPLEQRSRTAGAGTPLFDMLETCLVSLNSHLPNDLASRLRDHRQFKKILYELTIATAFHTTGYDVNWLPANISRKHPEFIASLHGRSIIGIECKQRDKDAVYERRASAFWKQFSYHLEKQMNANNLHYFIKLQGQKFSVKDVMPLTEEIISTLKQNVSKPLGTFATRTCSCQIHFVCLADINGNIPPAVLGLIPPQQYAVRGGTLDYRTPDSPALYKPRMIKLDVVGDPSQRINSVLRLLKDASEQCSSLPKNFPTLAYIDLDLGDWVDRPTEFNSIASRVTLALNAGSYKSISAVVVTDIYPIFAWNRHINRDVLGWQLTTLLIRNGSADASLPSHLIFPGDERALKWLPGHWVESASIKYI